MEERHELPYVLPTTKLLAAGHDVEHEPHQSILDQCTCTMEADPQEALMHGGEGILRPTRFHASQS